MFLFLHPLDILQDQLCCIFQLHFFQRHITVEIMTSFFAKFIRCVDKNMIAVFLICQHRICTSSKENSSG